MAQAYGRSSVQWAERRFFSTMAIIMLLAVLIGFAPSYYLRGVIPAPHPYAPMTPLVHLHGVVFTAWMVLFVTQTTLVSAGRVDLHRKLGIFGMVLVAVMIPLGAIVGIYGISRPLTAVPGIDPLSWSALPLIGSVSMVLLMVPALAKRHVPATHKRLMLLSMVNMLDPAFGRLLPNLGVAGPWGGMVPILFLIPLFVWDSKSLGRIHGATLYGSAIVAIRILITPVVWGTEWWMNFARWTTTLVP